MKRVCIVGASGKLGQYTIEHALARGLEVVGVCRAQSVGKLARFDDRITLSSAILFWPATERGEPTSRSSWCTR